MSDITTTKQQVIKKQNNFEFLPNFVKVKDTKSKKEFTKPRKSRFLPHIFFSLIALQTNQGHIIT